MYSTDKVTVSTQNYALENQGLSIKFQDTKNLMRNLFISWMHNNRKKQLRYLSRQVFCYFVFLTLRMWLETGTTQLETWNNLTWNLILNNFELYVTVNLHFGDVFSQTAKYFVFSSAIKLVALYFK